MFAVILVRYFWWLYVSLILYAQLYFSQNTKPLYAKAAFYSMLTSALHIKVSRNEIWHYVTPPNKWNLKAWLYSKHLLTWNVLKPLCVESGGQEWVSALPWLFGNCSQELSSGGQSRWILHSCSVAHGLLPQHHSSNAKKTRDRK